MNNKSNSFNSTCPTDIANICQDHALELIDFLVECKKHPDYKMGTNTKRFSWLPGYIVKYGVERVTNANILRGIIEKHKLTELAVPKKYIFKLFAGPDITNDNSLVLSELIDGPCGRGVFLFNLEQTKQMVFLADKGNYYDFNRLNLVLSDKDNKVYIIDTDSLAMPSPSEVKLLRTKYIKNGKGYIHDLQNETNDPMSKIERGYYSKWNSYTKDAGEYLRLVIHNREFIRKRLNGAFYFAHEIPYQIKQDALEDTIKLCQEYKWGLSDTKIKDMLSCKY